MQIQEACRLRAELESALSAAALHDHVLSPPLKYIGISSFSLKKKAFLEFEYANILLRCQLYFSLLYALEYYKGQTI